ncbi:hypothetical protein VTI74DRAFT_6010 [Chaetomium olivicolor]
MFLSPDSSAVKALPAWRIWTMTDAMSSSCVLWQNERKTVVLLDLPRSIEEAQVPSSELRASNDGGSPKKLRRLISALPPASPFPTPEPKAGGSGLPAASPSAQVAELMAQAAVESALEEIQSSYDGPWFLPRITFKPQPNNPNTPPLQSPRATATVGSPEAAPSGSLSTSPDQPRHPPSCPLAHHFPASSYPLLGSITTHRPTFLSATTPSQFSLILLDPPWPNRSAKRKRGSYTPAADLSSIRSLLSQIPVASRLAPGGYVAVWVTNAGRFVELLTNRREGIFAEWDVELVGEWIWLKVTTEGEPVVGVDSGWRKPWERLLIARKRGGKTERKGAVERKVIVSVPDVHSRKPNLRGLFERELGLPEGYEALEVFARNLTAGWWAWGDEVLLFQRRECWVEEDGEQEEGERVQGRVRNSTLCLDMV